MKLYLATDEVFDITHLREEYAGGNYMLAFQISDDLDFTTVINKFTATNALSSVQVVDDNNQTVVQSPKFKYIQQISKQHATTNNNDEVIMITLSSMDNSAQPARTEDDTPVVVVNNTSMEDIMTKLNLIMAALHLEVPEDNPDNQEQE